MEPAQLAVPFCGLRTKCAGLRLAHADNTARFAASGRRPTVIWLRVDVLTPVSRLTCVHAILRASTTLLSALKNDSALKRLSSLGALFFETPSRGIAGLR